MIKDFERIVIDAMIKDGIIPVIGLFQITECILDEYMITYGNMFDNKGKGLRKNSEIRFARRLAGLTLLKLNFERKVNFNDIQAGLVYIISNPSYPDHYKIGMTIELVSRLNTYQTYDPYRKFEVVKYDFVLNRSHIEKQLLEHPDITKEQGEWVLKDNAIKIFERICFHSGIIQKKILVNKK